jgi:hypothetical protein
MCVVVSDLVTTHWRHDHCTTSLNLRSLSQSNGPSFASTHSSINTNLKRHTSTHFSIDDTSTANIPVPTITTASSTMSSTSARHKAQSILLSPTAKTSSSTASRVSFTPTTPSRPQPATRMSQLVPEQKLKTMADLDREEEIRLANKHQGRTKVANKVLDWLEKKI